VISTLTGGVFEVAFTAATSSHGCDAAPAIPQVKCSSPLMARTTTKPLCSTMPTACMQQRTLLTHVLRVSAETHSVIALRSGGQSQWSSTDDVLARTVAYTIVEVG
jgi:hypothetical protein